MFSESISSSIIMMLSTGILVLVTVSLTAFGVSKGITKLFEHLT
jgi:SNF family Na+-dependent transporter